MQIPTIIQGLDFTLRIRAKRLGINRYVKVSFVEVANITANLVRLPSSKTALSSTIDTEGRLVIPISGEELVCTTYGIELLGFYNNGNWRHQIAPAFEIVQSSTEDNYALGESDNLTIDIEILIGETYASSRALAGTMAEHDAAETSHPYILQQLATLAQTVADIATAAAGGISTHNTSDTAHQDIRQSISGLTNAMQQAEAAMDALQTAIQSAGKVDDVQIDGTSILDNKIANIDSSQFGKVDDVQIDGTSILDNKVANINSSEFGKLDDVKVNGESVVINKEALITIPNKVSDLENDSEYVTDEKMQEEMLNKQDVIENVSSTYTEDGESPDVSVSMTQQGMEFTFKNLRGPAGPEGKQGIPGESAVFDPQTGNILAELASTTGSSTMKAMSQKATTDAIADPVAETVDVGTLRRYIKKIDGNEGTGDDYRASPYIPLYGEKKVSCATLYVGGSSSAIASIAFYDSNKTFLSAVIGTSAEVPNDAAFVRMTTTSSYSNFNIIRYGIPKQMFFDFKSRLPEDGRLDAMEESIEELEMEEITTTHQVSKGYVNYADGTHQANSTYYHTGYIKLNGEKKIKGDDLWVGGSGSTIASIAFYDSGKNWISSIRTKDEANVPDNAYYVRMTRKGSADITLHRCGVPKQDIYDRLKILESAVGSESYLELQGKTVAFIGDSITKGTYGVSAGKNFHAVFAQLTGSTDVNLGENSAVFVSNPSGGNSSHPRLIDKVTAANLSSADMVVVFAGTNDFSYDSKAIGSHFAEETITPNSRIGNKKRVPPSDTDTFSGAVHELILAIRAIIGEKPIVIMTPLNRGRTSASTYNPNTAECNINGDYMSDFVDALKDIGRFYSIPVFETGAYFNADPTDKVGTGQSTYFYDCLHPNDAGHERLGKLLYKFIANNLVV